MKKKLYTLLIAICVAVIAGGAFVGCNRNEDNDGEITLNTYFVEIEQYSEYVLTATLLNVKGDVAWMSDDTSVCSVKEGIISGVGAGTATITASVGKIKAKCAVRVVEITDAPVIRLSQNDAELFVGGIVTVSATVTFRNSTVDADIEWSSEDSSIAKVSDNGQITAIGVGKTKIIAKTKHLNIVAVKEVSVIVKENVTIVFNKRQLELKAHQINEGDLTSYQIECSVKRNGKDYEARYEYSSSDDKIAIVNDAGLVTAKGVGKTDINVRVTVGEKTYEERIAVEVLSSRIDLSQTLFEVCDGVGINGEIVYKDYVIDGSAYDVTGASASVKHGNIERECIVTVKDGQISVSGSAFGADMYGDGITMRVLTDNGIEYIVPMTVVTKYVADYEDLTNMQLYGGLAPELCGGKADTENDYNYDGYFIMTDNIDCGGYDTAKNGKKIASLYYALYNSADKGFKGVFDGKGFSIYNYWAMTDGQDNYKNGIFGNVQKSGVIKNLGIVGVLMIGKYHQDGAFLAYSFNGTLENCYIDIHNTSYSCPTLGKDINSASFNDVVIKCGWDKYYDGYGPTDGAVGEYSAGLAYRLGVYGASGWFNNAKPDNLVLFSDISHISCTSDKSYDVPFISGDGYIGGFMKFGYSEQPTQEVQFKDNTYWTLSDENQPIFITSQNRQREK